MTVNARRLQPVFILLSITALLVALWAGWIRLGWHFPYTPLTLPFTHGPLMVSGFLGTLISLERAVALQKRWMYLGALFSGLAGILLIFNATSLLVPLLFSLSSFFLVLIFIHIVRQHTAIYTVIMALGSVCWLVGNLFWFASWPFHRLVLWWAAFLVLTIAGERLELNRLLRLPKTVITAFIVIITIYLAGLVLSIPYFSLGTQVNSLGMILLGLWLLRYDISLRTVRLTGLPRYVALCLISGYLWLGFSGLLGLVYGGLVAGLIYDAFLHAIFIGFVISMIFGHGPIIFPSILGLPTGYTPVLYAPLFLLHLSLIIRIAGDLLRDFPVRLAGGLLNGIAILLFLGIMASSAISGKK